MKEIFQSAGLRGWFGEGVGKREGSFLFVQASREGATEVKAGVDI